MRSPKPLPDRDLTSLVHDARNWLSVAVAQLDLLQVAESSSISHRLSRARAALEACLELHEEALSPRSRRPGTRAPIDLLEVARSVVDLVRPQTPGGIRLEVSGASNRAAVDRLGLTNAVLNLIRNSIEALDGRGRIALGVTRDEACVILSVRDDGPGMDPATQARCRDASYTTKPSGSGIGLWSADAFVAEQGGRMRIKSGPDQGTQVDLVFPAAGEVRSDPVGEVLLVEDDPHVAEVLVEMIQVLGTTVAWVGDAASALAHIDRGKPGLCIVDHGLPDESGLWLAKRIRQRLPSVGIVLLTGQLEGIETEIGDEVDHVCLKPISLERLSHILEASQPHAMHRGDEARA